MPNVQLLNDCMLHLYGSISHDFFVVSSKILRKPDTLKTLRDIDKEEWKEIDEDLQVDC